jgi:hypothetical protein
VRPRSTSICPRAPAHARHAECARLRRLFLRERSRRMLHACGRGHARRKGRPTCRLACAARLPRTNGLSGIIIVAIRQIGAHGPSACPQRRRET